MSDRKKRRRWTASEKLRVVVTGLEGSVEISELCRREGINPTQYYLWKKQLMGSAAKGLAGMPGGFVGGLLVGAMLISMRQFSADIQILRARMGQRAPEPR